jgi:HK97 family phage prohead protease
MIRHKVKSAPPPGDDRQEFIMSDGSIDRMGDIIEPSGWDLSSFSPGKTFNPIALFNHRSDNVVGSWSDVKVRNGQLIGKFVPAAEGTSEIADSVRKLVDQNILRAVSVGFDPIEMEPLTKESDPYFGPFRFKKQVLLECSIVSVPANANAVALARSMNVSDETFAKLFSKTAGRDATGIQTGKTARHLAPKGTKQMSNLSTMIEASQKQINEMRDLLTALSNKDERDETEEIQFEELPDRIEEKILGLEKLQKAERAMARTVTQLPAVVPQVAAPAVLTKNKIRPLERPGDLIVRVCAIRILSHITHRHPEDLLREMYGNDEQTGMVLKTASGPALTTQAGWAAELVQTATADFVDTLKPDRIYPSLSAGGLRFTFGRNGVIKIPARAASPTLAGDWILEGAPIPVKQMGFTSVTLTPKKLAVISTFTREIAAHSTPAIEGIIREAMSDDTAFVIDTALVSSAAATTAKPAGLLNGVSALTPSALTNPAQAMVADVGALINAITAVNGGRQLYLLVNPAQGFNMGLVQTTTGDFLFGSTQEASNKLGVTIVRSTVVPAKTVICVDAADFVSVTGDVPEYEVSDQATLHMEDNVLNVLPISSVGTPNTVAAPVRSLWQTASIGVRFLLDMNWAMRRTGMVSWTQNVLW